MERGICQKGPCNSYSESLAACCITYWNGFFQLHLNLYEVQWEGASIFWVKLIVEKRWSSAKTRMLWVFILVHWSIIENTLRIEPDTSQTLVVVCWSARAIWTVRLLCHSSVPLAMTKFPTAEYNTDTRKSGNRNLRDYTESWEIEVGKWHLEYASYAVSWCDIQEWVEGLFFRVGYVCHLCSG